MNNLDSKVNRKRPAGKTMPNMYLITIPRCDLPKKFIFRGLEPLCNRLLVSKEAHTISYIDSCCKNSSLKKRSSNCEKSECLSSFFNKEKYHFKLLNSQECFNGNSISNESEISSNVSNLIDCISETTNSNISINVCTQETNPSYIEQKLNYSKPSQTTHNNYINNISIAKKSVKNCEKFKQEEEWIHCKSHLHIFAEFNEEHIVDFEKCDRIMNWCSGGYKTNIEACKSAKNAIIYCTKEDANPILKNISPDECAFYKKLIDWIKENPEFNYYDPFICSRPNLYKMIVLAHTDFYKKNPIQLLPCYGLRIVDLETNGCKTKNEILKWFNECVSNWRYKYPALYLWGESNSGKTTMIFDWLLKKIVHELQIFRPARNCQFAWADYDMMKHRVVVMDEFEFSQFDNEEWKNLVEGRPTAVRVKGRSSKIISVKCPIIMISNYPPPYEKKEIINRLNIVKSEHN